MKNLRSGGCAKSHRPFERCPDIGSHQVNALEYRHLTVRWDSESCLDEEKFAHNIEL